MRYDSVWSSRASCLPFDCNAVMDILPDATTRHAALNDWDLAVVHAHIFLRRSHLPTLPPSSLLPSPSSISFAAVDLFSKTPITPHPSPHLYRHGLESFLASSSGSTSATTAGGAPSSSSDGGIPPNEIRGQNDLQIADALLSYFRNFLLAAPRVSEEMGERKGYGHARWGRSGQTLL